MKKKKILFILGLVFLIFSCKKETLGIEMIKIPGKNFEMSKTEITQEIYEKIMGENPSESKGKSNPVENIRGFDAFVFCNKLSEMEGLTPVYSVRGKKNVEKWNYTLDGVGGQVIQDDNANGYRLPSEEEWLFAAKGGEEYKYAGSNDIDEVAWNPNNSKGTQPVAQKKANGFGLYDMIGNVEELCFNKRLCGGSFYWFYSFNNTESRVYSFHHKYSDVGFRIVRTISE